MAKKSSGAGASTIKVDTTAVRNAVTTLTTLNNDMDKAFDNVKSAMSKLDSNWDGTASSKAISNFNKLKNDFMGANGRKAVMKTYISFLTSAVATDYENTETTNTNLGSLFK